MNIFSILKVATPALIGGMAHPGCDRLAHALLERKAEGAIAAITAVDGQLLGRERTLGSDCLAIEADEMIDAQTIDIGIVGGVLAREILAEIGAVGTYLLGKLGHGQVVQQVEVRSLAMLLQQEA